MEGDTTREILSPHGRHREIFQRTSSGRTDAPRFLDQLSLDQHRHGTRRDNVLSGETMGFILIVEELPMS